VVTEIRLPRQKLEELRDRLQQSGKRPSMILPVSAPNVIEALHVVEEYGLMCEALYLVMAADRRVLNVEREVMRGALDVLSDGRVRTAHMESMIDAAARRIADQGEAERLNRVIDSLQDDRVRAEATVVLAAAIAAADGVITPEEQAMLDRLADGLGVSQIKADQLLDSIASGLQKPEKQ
jgi:tellurite resistance protein